MSNWKEHCKCETNSVQWYFSFMAETDVHILKHLFTHLVDVFMCMLSGDCKDFTVLSKNYVWDELLA